MRHWLRWNIRRARSAEERLAQLDRALNATDGLGLAETDDWSGDAGEVFARREADCVGYAFLFYAFARELGVDVEFVVEVEVDRVEERPGLRVVRRHLAVVHRPSATVYDFGGPRPYGRSIHTPIGAGTARAILESNRGAHDLLRGDLEVAVETFHRATTIDPELALAWSHLAVALRRLGDETAARAASVRAEALTTFDRRRRFDPPAAQ